MKHLLFDLDQTLFDFKQAERKALELTFEQLGLTIDESIIIRYSQINDRMWKMLEKGEIDKQSLRSERFNQLKQELGLNVDTLKISTLYTENLGKQGILFDHALDVLKYCSELLPCSVASNGLKEVQFGRIERAGIGKYFQNIFVSEEIGAEKPDQKYFSHILEKLDLKACEIGFIGDSLSADMLGGANAGLMTIWYNPQHERNDRGIAIDYEIDDLTKLCEIVAKELGRR